MQALVPQTAPPPPSPPPARNWPPAPQSPWYAPISATRALGSIKRARASRPAGHPHSVWPPLASPNPTPPNEQGSSAGKSPTRESHSSSRTHCPGRIGWAHIVLPMPRIGQAPPAPAAGEPALVMNDSTAAQPATAPRRPKPSASAASSASSTSAASSPQLGLKVRPRLVPAANALLLRIRLSATVIFFFEEGPLAHATSPCPSDHRR